MAWEVVERSYLTDTVVVLIHTQYLWNSFPLLSVHVAISSDHDMQQFLQKYRLHL
jgi:hypothetical protein